MPPVPPQYRPPAASARPVYQRVYNSQPEEKTLSDLIGQGADKSPLLAKGAKPSNDMGGTNRRMVISTIQGMLADALKRRGMQNVPISYEPPKDNVDNRSYFWAGGPNKNTLNDYGIVIRPGYVGAPRGLEAAVDHEAAHAGDMLTNHPDLAHGPSFRDEERSQFMPGVKLYPKYGGNDYAGKNEYADSFQETGDKYTPHVFMSNYDDPRVRPYRVNEKDMKKAIAANRKAYVANLKNPPAPKLRVTGNVRGL